MKAFSQKTALLIATLAVACSMLNAATVTISGAGSAARILSAYKAQIESKSGQTIIIKAKNSRLGVEDLINGDAQLAIISGPAGAMYKYLGLTEGTTAPLRTTKFYRDRLCFIVNPANPITSLTKEQLVAIFTGKITNWKEVGGLDLQIRVMTVDRSNGFRLAADMALWGDTPLACAAERDKSAEMVPEVSRSPEAISFIASSDLAKGVKKIESPQIFFDMNFVCNGSPNVEQRAVIDAAKELLLK